VLQTVHLQVIAVGDFNIASEPCDVHSTITWDTLYAQSELRALHQLTSTLEDSWRRLHPQQEGVYTVWDEKTSARAFNVVSVAALGWLCFVESRPFRLPSSDCCARTL
jgi:exonuclease III